jgi:23S rRNA pseudouridine2605 synthase
MASIETNLVKMVYFSSFVLKNADYSGKIANFAAQYKNYIQDKMTRNDKWQGNSKSNSNSGAGRDGKSFEKRDLKSILKGTRGAAKKSFDKPHSDNRTEKRDDNRGDKLDFKKRDQNQSSFGERKPYENRGNSSYGERKPYENRGNSGNAERKPYENRGNSSYGERKPYESREGKPSFGEKRSYESRGNSSFGERKPYESREGKPSFGEKRPYENRVNSNNGERKPYENRDGERKPYENRGNSSYGERKPYENRGSSSSFNRKPYENKESDQDYGERRPYPSRDNNQFGKPFKKSYDSNDGGSNGEKLTFKKPGEVTPGTFVETRYDKEGVTFRKPLRKSDDYDPNAKYSQKKQAEFRKNTVDLTQPIRLNKFLANAGICSRREADEYIQAGVISVNGEVVSELGVKVMHDDKVMFHNQLVRSEKKVYLLLNKPKDCVTTSEDTHDRLTVLDLVKNACSERIYPVGRLDRNTTGVILLTNDGDLASKLTHPKYDKKKIYHVALDKALEMADFETVLKGVTLDDGLIAADALEFVKEGDPKQIGIEIHSGQNRVVRRIFEKLGYKVIRLDRVYFAGLTKKNIQRGKYRFLTEREVNMLKMGAYE